MPGGMSEETILQFIVPPQASEESTAAAEAVAQSKQVPVSSLNTICYVDTSGFVHLRGTGGAHDISLETGGALPEYVPISVPASAAAAAETEPRRKKQRLHRSNKQPPT